jgi:hypothetical protein
MKTSEQKFTEQILKAMSQYYRQTLSRQIKQRIAAKKIKKLPTA